MADYAEVLLDLKKEFNGKILLSPADIAPYISKSAEAQWALRERGNFPIKYSKMGRSIVIKIYDLARYFADDQEMDAVNTPTPPKPKPKAVAAAKKGLTMNQRRIPNFAKTLMLFGQQVEQQEMQLDFMRQLFAELERIELMRDIKILPKRIIHDL